MYQLMSLKVTSAVVALRSRPSDTTSDPAGGFSEENCQRGGPCHLPEDLWDCKHPLYTGEFCRAPWTDMLVSNPLNLVAGTRRTCACPSSASILLLKKTRDHGLPVREGGIHWSREAHCSGLQAFAHLAVGSTLQSVTTICPRFPEGTQARNP